MRPALCCLVWLGGCGTRDVPRFETTEWLPGGDATNTLLMGSNAFLRPAQNLTPEHLQDFYSGNSFFNQGWVEAPASTDTRDGLGPLFNARSCSACHFRDGKGAPPDSGEAPFVGLLLRLSVEEGAGLAPHPVYGIQLQDQANPGVPVEALPRIVWTEIPGSYQDGTPYALIAPEYVIEETGYGPLTDALISPRVAPHMIGLGLLEAIPERDLAWLEDPDDRDGDGISGRRQILADGRTGRFGWKGEAPSVEQQTSDAFVGDMGLTTPLALRDQCTDEQLDCLLEQDGGVPEVEPHIFDLVVLYTRAVAVPARRNAESRDLLAGRAAFYEVGCAGCHVPSAITEGAALPEFDDQLIWPYTDLLLHDMGPGLADGRPVGSASGREWKTPPLWGLGLMQAVSGHTRFLHDGRARNLEEAILWHGGEAASARDAFVALPAEERAQLLDFVSDL